MFTIVNLSSLSIPLPLPQSTFAIPLICPPVVAFLYRVENDCAILSLLFYETMQTGICLTIGGFLNETYPYMRFYQKTSDC